MAIAGACVILLMLWTLLAYLELPLPLSIPVFAWLQRQWIMEGTAVLACLGMAGALWTRRRRAMTPIVPWLGAWAVWLTWAVLSTAYSIDRGVTLRALVQFLSYGLLGILVSMLAQAQRGGIRVWARFLVIIAVLACIEGLVQYFKTFNATLHVFDRLQGSGRLQLQGWGSGVIRDFLARKRIFSFFGWPNLFAGFLLLTIPMAIGLGRSSDSRRTRLAWMVSAALLGICLLLTLSLGGWIAAVLTSALLWCVEQHRQVRGSPRATPYRNAALLAVAAVGLCLGLLCVAMIVSKRGRPFITSSISSRWVYVASSLEAIRVSPWWGTGFGTFGLAYWSLMPEPYVGGQYYALHAHNTLLEFGVELGLIGLGLFSLFLVRVGRMIRGALAHGVRKRSQALAWGLGAGLTGFFIHSVLEQTFVEAVTAPFWWVVLGLLTAATMQPRHPETVNGGSDSSERWRWVVGGASCIGLGFATLLTLSDAWAARGAFLDLAGRYQEAERAFGLAERWNPLESRHAMEQGERALLRASEQGDRSGERVQRAAQQAFKRAVELSQWSGYAWLRLGMISWDLGEPGPAVAALRQAVRRDPNSAAALDQLGLALTGIGGSPEERLAVGTKLQRLDPSNARGWFLEAAAWQALNQPPRAIAAYTVLTQRFPDHYPAWFNLAELQRQSGAMQEARVSYAAFLRLSPTDHMKPRAFAQRFLEEQALADGGVNTHQNSP